MVNYCCVSGCGRNSKTSKHLFYYGLPKESPRLEQWLLAIGREDLLGKYPKRLSHRICSRHFSPSSIKNKHLCADALPTMCLPNQEAEEEDTKQWVHSEIICNSCNKPILGFRYKCITCPDYDLCSKCEMFETHADHYLLRIPKPVDFKEADELIKKWQQLVNIKHVTVDSYISEGSSDDDMPITKYIKQNDYGIDLPEDVKTKIRNEVARVLDIKHVEPKKVKRKQESKKKEGSKKRKMVGTVNNSCDTRELETMAPEVVFADVNDGQLLDIKDEIHTTLEETQGSMTDLALSDADFILTSLN